MAVLLAALAGAASARAPTSSSTAGTQCRAGETVLYSCSFPGGQGSVCAAPGRIAYRYGPAGRPAIDIASEPGWKNIHMGRIVGGGGGYQNHVRFTAAGHDYVVFEAVAGELTDVPGKRWSGIHVQRADDELATLTCGRERATAQDLRRAEDFAPAGTRDRIEEDDPRFAAWF